MNNKNKWAINKNVKTFIFYYSIKITISKTLNNKSEQ